MRYNDGMRLYYRNGWAYISFKRGVSRALNTTDKKLAEDIFKELLKEKSRGRLIQLDRSSMKLLADFTAEYLATRKSMSHNTYRADRLALNKLQEFFGNRPMVGLSDQKLEASRSFLLSEGNRQSSCNTHIRHLRGALKKARKWGYLKKSEHDILDGLKKFKLDNSVEIYATTDEVRFLLAVAGDYCPEMQRAIALQYYTGMGRAEVTSRLVIRDSAITYKRVKTGKTITVDISDQLRPYLEGMSGIVRILPWRNIRTYSKHYAEIATLAGIPHITPHKLRHTFATHLLAAGVDIKTISEMMGHSSIQITMDLYGHLLPGRKKDALNRLKL